MDDWTILSFPLLAEADDALGRPIGALLWPERFSETDFPSVERGQISSRSFAALYQQRPTAAEGDIFKAAWFKRYVDPPKLRKTVLAVDCASKTGVANDESAFAVIGKSETGYYVMHVESARLEFPDLERRIVELAQRWQPATIVIEDASAGTQLTQTLKRSTTLPIVPVTARQSKIVRAELLTGLFESGRVYFPENALWAEDVIDEMTRFPAVKHDDRTDAVMHGITYLSQAQNLMIPAFVDWGSTSEIPYGSPGDVLHFLGRL